MARNSCGYCGELGHNRRSCPHLTSDLKRSFEAAKRSAEEVAKNYGEGSAKHISALRTLEHYTRRVSERTGKNPHTNMPTEKKKRTVRCSYCKAKGNYEEAIGHTRRSCPAMKEDAAKYHAANKDYRRLVVKILNEEGVVPGSLISKFEYGKKGGAWNYHEYTYMVTGFNLDQISVTHARAPIVNIMPMGTARSRQEQIRVMSMPMQIIDGRYTAVEVETGKATEYNPNSTADRVNQHKMAVIGGLRMIDPEDLKARAEAMRYPNSCCILLSRGSDWSPPEGWYDKESPAVKEHLASVSY
tara:strand:- start:147 stop:1046 length:900 start_codon:yes stop_codon:yes gene_type:complete